MSKTSKRRLPLKVPDDVPNVGPLDATYERCEKFASNMLASYFLHNLPVILAEDENDDDPYHKLEMKLAMQIVFDSIDESGLPN